MSFLPGWFPGVTEAPPAIATYITSNGSVHNPFNNITFTAQTLGANFATRKFYLIRYSQAFSGDDRAATLSCTLDGILGTELHRFDPGSSSPFCVALYTWPKSADGGSTNTTGDIAFTHAGSNDLFNTFFSLFTIDKLVNPDVVQAAVEAFATSSNGHVSDTVALKKGGALIGSCVSVSTSGVQAWTGPTKDTQISVDISGGSQWGSGHLSEAPLNPALTWDVQTATHAGFPRIWGAAFR